MLTFILRQGDRIGNYEAPYLAETLYKLFYVGRLPVGIRFKRDFEYMPLPAIAYAAAVVRSTFYLFNLYSCFALSSDREIHQLSHHDWQAQKTDEGGWHCGVDA